MFRHTLGMSVFLAGVLLLLTSPLFAATTLWGFDPPSYLAASSGYSVMDYRSQATETNTSFWVTDGWYVPHIEGQAVNYMWYPLSGNSGGFRVERPWSSPTLASYTLAWDMLIGQNEFNTYDYLGIFNTNPYGTDDAELFVDLRENLAGEDPRQGRLFVDRDSDDAKVYSTAGVIQPDTWHRIAIAYDESDPLEHVRLFVDGVKVGASDNTFGHSVLRLRETFCLFQDGGPKADHAPGLVASMALVDRALTDAEIATLGSPKANGFASLNDPGDPPPSPPSGSTAYADAVAATNPLVYLRLSEPPERQVGDPLVNNGTLGTGLAGTWGVDDNGKYPYSAPQSGVVGLGPRAFINGHSVVGLEDDNTAAGFVITRAPDPISGNLRNWASILNVSATHVPEVDQDDATYSLFLQTGDTSSWPRIIVSHPNNENRFLLTMSSGMLTLVTNYGTGWHVADSVDRTFNDGQWHHVVAIRNGDNAADAKLYVDGEEVSLTVRSGSFQADFAMRVGAWGTTSGWAGLADEIAIWGRALSEEEALGLYYAAIGGAPPTSVPGDANGDGKVNDADAKVLAANWGASGGWTQGDFNKDGVINAADAAILAANWGHGVGETTAIPEPSTAIALLMLAVSFWFGRGRSRV